MMDATKTLSDNGALQYQPPEYAPSLIEASLDPLVLIGPEGTITDVNEATVQVTGVPRNQLIGTDFADYFTEPAKARAGYQQVFARGSVTNYPLTIRHRDGQLTDVLYNASVYRDTRGNVLGVCAAARDLTALKQSEAQLRNAQATLEAQRLAALSLAEAELAARQRAERAEQEVHELNEVLEQRVQDRMAEVEDANQMLQREINVRTQAQARLSKQARLATLIGDTGTALTRAGTLRAVLQQCAAAVVEHLDAAFARIWILNHQDQVLELQASAGLYTQLDGAYGRVRVGQLKIGRIAQEKKPYLTNDVCKDPLVSDHLWARREGLVAFVGHPLLVDGDLLGVVALFARQPLSDPTLKTLAIVADNLALGIKRKLAEESLQRANRELEQQAASLAAANKELDAFSYSVSHDLRAPLRAIDGFSRILLEEYAAHLPAEGQRYLRTTRENTQRMDQLINDLLAFSRLGRQKLEKRPVALTALVQTVLAELREETAERQVEVSVGALPDCQADAALLKQVFTNLLANAFKFTRAQPAARIEIGCRNDGPTRPPIYFVKDNGAGFDMHYASKLFGVFQRLHSEEDYPGTGVGLAIVQRIIHRHGGRVWAEGAVNEGATFYFTLSEGGES